MTKKKTESVTKQVLWADSNSDRTKIPTSDAKILDIGCEKVITLKLQEAYPATYAFDLSKEFSN